MFKNEPYQTRQRPEYLNPAVNDTHREEELKASRRFIETMEMEKGGLNFYVEAELRRNTENADLVVDADAEMKPAVVMSMDAEARTGVRFDVVYDAVPAEQMNVTTTERGDVVIPAGRSVDEMQMETFRQKEAEFVFGDQMKDKSQALDVAREWQEMNPKGFEDEIEQPARNRAVQQQFNAHGKEWTAQAVSQMRDVARETVSNIVKERNGMSAQRVSLTQPSKSVQPKNAPAMAAGRPVGVDVS